MIGHQPTKRRGGSPPNTTVRSLVKEDDLTALTEQLNGLLDRYKSLYDVATKYINGNPKLFKVLDNVEKAIEALCVRITSYEIKIEE